MKYILLFALLVAIVFGTGTSAARAQYAPPAPVNPYIRPPYSPYLNLLRPGASPAINYYGIVRPELDARANLLGLAQQTALNQQGLTSFQQDLTGAITTGHTVGFMTQRRYFMTFSSGSVATGGSFGTFGGGTNIGRGAPTAPSTAGVMNSRR